MGNLGARPLYGGKPTPGFSRKTLALDRIPANNTFPEAECSGSCCQGRKSYHSQSHLAGKRPVSAILFIRARANCGCV